MIVEAFGVFQEMGVGVDTYLVLDEKLDALNGSGGSLRDGGGNTTHCRGLSA